MNFGQALEKLKNGSMIARTGWNGRGMYVYLEDALAHTIGYGPSRVDTRRYEPFICMYTAEGKHQPGWLASQADMLAEDWVIAQGIHMSEDDGVGVER